MKTTAELEAMTPRLRDAWITAELIAAQNTAIRALLLDSLRGTA